MTAPGVDKRRGLGAGHGREIMNIGLTVVAMNDPLAAFNAEGVEVDRAGADDLEVARVHPRVERSRRAPGLRLAGPEKALDRDFLQL